LAKPDKFPLQATPPAAQVTTGSAQRWTGAPSGGAAGRGADWPASVTELLRGDYNLVRRSGVW